MRFSPPVQGVNKVGEMEPLAHQKNAHDEIVKRASAYFNGEWIELSLIPLWASLIISPTGTGKTATAAMAAEAVGASMLRVSAPNYMPCGSNNRGARETISVIAEHVAKHDKTMLLLDELDKIIDRQGDSSWKTYIRGELFDLLDGRWPAGLVIPDLDDDKPNYTIEALTEKLRHTVFILACGTFQSWFDGAGSRRKMGFGAEANPAKEELTADVVAEKMPRELANRMNSNLIQIPELTPDDYCRIAKEAENQLPLRMRDAFRAEVTRLMPGAISAKKGVRFLEEAMLTVLINSPKAISDPQFSLHDL